MCKKRILEVNIDDLNYGGVYAFIKTVIDNKPSNLHIDIASIEGFSNKKNKSFFIERGCKVFFVGSQKNKIIKQIYVYKNMLVFLKKSNYDCVHIHADTANKLLVSGLAAKKAGINRIILHSHASGTEGKYRKIKEVIHKVCRKFLRLLGADCVACSDLAAKWMYDSIDNVTVINNGIDLDKFKFDLEIRKKVRDLLKINDQILIGHVGRYCYPKNHRFMLKIAQELKRRKQNIKIIFIGNGEMESQIKNMTKEMDVSDRIIFYGTSDRVQDLLQAMDVFILPSISEGFPIVGIEAQASGLPVIFSNTLSKTIKLSSNVDFINISDHDVPAWCDRIYEFAQKERRDISKDLANAGVGIDSTISKLVNLYTRA